MSVSCLITENNKAYRTYGIAHFSGKYGLPEGLASSIQTKCSDLQDHIACWRDTPYGRIPFFEELGNSEPIEFTESGITVNYDIWNAIGTALSGSLEHLSPEEKTQTAHIPFVDIYEEMLFDSLREYKKDRGILLEKKPFWPNGKKFALCLTHDIDEIRKTYQYFTRPIIHLKRKEAGRSLNHVTSFFSDKANRRNPYWTFPEMLSTEEKLGVRSTSYFLQESGEVKLHKPSTFKLKARKYLFNNPAVSDVIKAMCDGGWEVGLHGSYYSYKDPLKISSEKRDLKAVLGSEPAGIRQHHLNMLFPKTWEYQQQAGLEYDTSLGFRDCNGFRWGTCFPFQPFNRDTHQKMDILELPLTVMDTTLFTREKEADSEILSLIDAVEERGGLFTVLFHHTIFNGREYPGWTERYK